VPSFLERRRRVSSAGHARGFDFRRPLEPHVASDPGLEGIVEDHGPYGEMQTSIQPLAVLVDQARRNAVTYDAASGCVRLEPGARFALDGHELPALDAGYVVVELVHRFRSVQDADAPAYQNKLVAAQKDFCFVRHVRVAACASQWKRRSSSAQQRKRTTPTIWVASKCDSIGI